MKKAQIFFSYARENSKFVLKLAKDLRMTGANIWLDQLDIEVGDRWDQSIHEALKNCETLLVILTPESVNSQNVMDEVSYALEEGKQVMPILHSKCDVPFRVRRLQRVDFTGDYKAGFTQLVHALKVESETDPAKEPVSQNNASLENQKPVSKSLDERRELRPQPQPTSQKAGPRLNSVFLKASIGALVVALIGLLGFTAWKLGWIGRDSNYYFLGSGPYHLGDEKINGWPQVYGSCFKSGFTTELPVKNLRLTLETYGAENGSINLNGHFAASLPPQLRKREVKSSRPNYWSKERSVILPTDLLKSGSNKFSLCADPVANPEFAGDKDDLQIRNLKILVEK